MILEALAGFYGVGRPVVDRAYMNRGHDFRRAVRAIEVKTSMRSDSTRVTIHGAEQLLPPGDGSMHLAHVRLEQADAGSATVSRLRERIIGVGVDATLLDAGLSKLDYDQTSAKRVGFVLPSKSRASISIWSRPIFPESRAARSETETFLTESWR